MIVVTVYVRCDEPGCSEVVESDCSEPNAWVMAAALGWVKVARMGRAWHFCPAHDQWRDL